MYMFFIVKSRNASIIFKIDSNKFWSELIPALFIKVELSYVVTINLNFYNWKLHGKVN